MAKPIKETPIIFGEDAKRFNQSIKDVKPASDDKKRRGKRIQPEQTVGGRSRYRHYC